LATQKESKKAEQCHDSSEGKLIFWVEDYQGMLEGWRTLLENEGDQVLRAVDANRAMRLFISQRVDEVVLDYQLLGLTADAIAREMKAIKPEVPILMLADDRRLSEEQLKPADGLLPKASSRSVLLEQVRELLDRRGLKESSRSNGNEGAAVADTLTSKD
jgi:DNA-binding response OmpR family regulator